MEQERKIEFGNLANEYLEITRQVQASHKRRRELRSAMRPYFEEQMQKTTKDYIWLGDIRVKAKYNLMARESVLRELSNYYTKVEIDAKFKKVNKNGVLTWNVGLLRGSLDCIMHLEVQKIIKEGLAMEIKDLTLNDWAAMELSQAEKLERKAAKIRQKVSNRRERHNEEEQPEVPVIE